jgi:hypothetical protein
MADGGKFGGKRRRELKEGKKYIYKKIIEGDVSVFG